MPSYAYTLYKEQKSEWLLFILNFSWLSKGLQKFKKLGRLLIGKLDGDFHSED